MIPQLAKVWQPRFIQTVINNNYLTIVFDIIIKKIII